MDQKTITFGDREYTLDNRGFLNPPEQWDEVFAEGMARNLEIYEGLTENHWAFIRYLRDKFLVEKTVPVVVRACADNGMRLNRLRELFPTGYHRGACKIAGINYEFMYNSNIWLTYEMDLPSEETFTVDELGFLRDFAAWDERFAHASARKWNLPEGLTDDHWRVIKYIREAYGSSQRQPTIFEVCNNTGIGLDEIGSLFPTGYHRGACRAAGLPFIA